MCVWVQNQISIMQENRNWHPHGTEWVVIEFLLIASWFKFLCTQLWHVSHGFLRVWSSAIIYSQTIIDTLPYEFATQESCIELGRVMLQVGPVNPGLQMLYVCVCVCVCGYLRMSQEREGKSERARETERGMERSRVEERGRERQWESARKREEERKSERERVYQPPSRPLQRPWSEQSTSATHPSSQPWCMCMHK